MDHSRYLAYRSVARSLDRMPEWLLDSHERERLRDTAEALLLTTDVALTGRLRHTVIGLALVGVVFWGLGASLALESTPPKLRVRLRT